MAFPTTVTPISSSCEAPGKYGPYLAGADRWLILFERRPIVDDFSFFINALKSTDGGLTWAVKDSFDTGATVASLNGALTLPYTSVQSTTDPTKIYVLMPNQSTSLIGVFMLDTTTGLFGPFLADSPLLNFFFGHLQTGANNGFIVATYRPDDSIVLAMPQNDYFDSANLDHIVSAFAVYNVAGNSWGASTPLGFEDFASTINWDQIPCGMCCDNAGTVHVFSQQVTRITFGGGLTFMAGMLDIPWDCTTIQQVIFGGGGGGASSVLGVSGGGGASGARQADTIAVTPLSTIAGPVLGAGGAGGVYAGTEPGDADGQDGTPTTWNGKTAAGGGGAKADGTGAGGTGGGNDGGVGFPTLGGGGGGGGTDSQYSAGSVGGDGTVYTGSGNNAGPGGLAGLGSVASGGNGGQYDPSNLGGCIGGPGNSPAAGGGGGAANSDGGQGGDADFQFTYTPVQGTLYNSRLWHQGIRADNTLTSQAEISDGQAPCLKIPTTLIIPFDCDARAGSIVAAFSGAVATDGYAKIEALRAPNAESPTFTSQLIDTGSTAAIEPGVGICLDADANGWLAYKRAATPTAFEVREDPLGAGFGAPSTVGRFDDPYCRIQVAVLDKAPEITFAKPTIASAGWLAPG